MISIKEGTTVIIVIWQERREEFILIHILHHDSSALKHRLNLSAAISTISGESMTLTEKGNSTADSIGETPGEKVNHRHNNVDAGSNGGNVNQHSQTRVEVDLNSADQLLWRCPQCSYTNNEEISRAVFGDTDEWTQVCVICYISCPCEVNSA
jgi:hypothetical protein